VLPQTELRGAPRIEANIARLFLCDSYGPIYHFIGKLDLILILDVDFDIRQWLALDGVTLSSFQWDSTKPEDPLLLGGMLGKLLQNVFEIG
jgi:hypothetical protein